MDFQNYSYSNLITTVDVASTVNLPGVYFNGSSNTGVGATLRLSSIGLISIDSVQIKKNTNVLLKDQTNQNENGIYFCIQEGNAFFPTILQRRKDFHNIEQIRAGQFLFVGKGENNKGLVFTIVDPLPNQLGIDEIFFVSQSTDTNFTSNVPTPAADEGGESYAFTSTYTQTVPVNGPNEKIGAILGRLNMNGMILDLPGYVAGVTGDLTLQSGSYQSGVLAGLLSTLHLKGTISPTTINGAEIYGLAARVSSYPDVPTDISGIIGLGLLNFQGGQRIGTFIRCVGFANKFAEFDGATSTYFVTAGSAPGSAGDPTKCNAQNVLVCSFDDVPCFIPLFNSNA